jgi:hypothetical protein
VLQGFSHRLDQPPSWTWIKSVSDPSCSMNAKVMPEKKGKFLGLISNRYEGRVQTGKCVCKKLLILTSKGTSFIGEVLHTCLGRGC